MRQELGVNVACLGDLQGPKFRVGEPLGSERTACKDVLVRCSKGIWA